MERTSLIRQCATRTVKLNTLLVVGIVTTALLGCGGSTSTTTKVVTSQPPGTSTTTVPQPKQTEAVPTSTAAREPNHEGPGTVPDETRVRLDVAEIDLKRRGLSYRVIAPTGTSALNVKSKWTVCETNPSPRTHLETGTTIRLIVARSCQRGAP